ncbi:MAG: type IV pilus assembly protein FimV, partial [Burkholderiaceae bacterium]
MTMNDSRQAVRWLLMLLASLFLLAEMVFAQPMPDTARALKTLMEAKPATSEQSASGGASMAAGSMPGTPYVVRRGDTLVSLVSKMYGTHPFKNHAVFGIIVQRNPQSFLKGNPNRLLEGTRLVFPNAKELHQVLAGQHPELASAIAAKPEQPSAGQGSG